MNCIGLLTTLEYDGPPGLVSAEAKDDSTVANEDRFTVYEYGANNSGTQQTSKTVYEGLDASGTKLNATTYSYNLQGRMSQVDVDSDGDSDIDTTSQYEYADDGTRVSETVNGTKTLFVVDRQNPTGYSQVLEEKNSSGAVLKTYTLGLDIISQQAPAIQSGATLYLLKDGHGSTRGLVDALGLPLSGQIYRYDAFGNAIGFSPANALTSRLYNSEPFLGSIGLYDFRFRPFDPPTGRFLFMDDPRAGKLNNPLTLHKYLFAHGDGINFNDPTGKFEGLTGLLVNMAIGNILVSVLSPIIKPAAQYLAYSLLPIDLIESQLRAATLSAGLIGVSGSFSGRLRSPLTAGFGGGADLLAWIPTLAS